MEKIETVYQSILKYALLTPQKVAIISGDQSITYEMLADQIDRLSESLLELGVRPSQRIPVETIDPINNLVGLIGTMAIGAIPVALPISDPVAYEAIIEDSSPVLILGGSEVSTSIRELGTSLKNYRIGDLIRQRSGENISRSLKFLKRISNPDEIAMIYYTSGTSSGIRKGVMQSYKTLHKTANYIVNITQLTDEVREFVASPLDNAFWFGRCRIVFKVGGTLLLHGGTLNPLAIIDSMKRNKGNAISGDTPIFLLLINFMEKIFRQIVPEIKWVKIASQHMPIKDKEKLISILPSARIVMGYGLTEAMRTSLLPFSDFPNKLNSDGRPCPGVFIKIEGPDGKDLPPNETGEILISGDNLASGYLNKEKMWEEKFDGKWYRSGDLGYLDSDGFLNLLGRKDQAINSGGKTIALMEVENRIRPYISAKNFLVCGIPDPKGVLGEIIALCIEGNWIEKNSWKDFRILLFENMDPIFVPKEAFCIPSFPRTSNGKIQVGTIREKIINGLYQKCQ